MELKKTLSFQAEIQQLLKIMINSLYSNKEIFLRELISNASDALDKLRFEILNNNQLNSKFKPKIRINYNKLDNTISILDNGIGMSKKEIILNLGTIAKSGTKDFISNLTKNKKKKISLIGQFGVGFYSAFIVSKKIIVKSRKINKNVNKGVCWESNGKGEFTIQYINKKKRGTEVILVLNSKGKKFLYFEKLKNIVKKYSNHISIPIEIKKDNKYEIVNQTKSLWTKKKSDINKKEYENFYKNIFNTLEKPLIYSHNIVEGLFNYIQLLYIPKKFINSYLNKNKFKGLKLYIKKVFIMDATKYLLPSYLRFVKGIIDSTDLPLNISREVLQKSYKIKIIKESSIKRILNILKELSNKNKNKYNIFWKNFGLIFKEGIGEDLKNREILIELLRFNSTLSKNRYDFISLSDYLKRMKKNQNKIYFLTAENYESAKNSPHLEYFYKKNIEVLLLIDRIDEWLLSFLKEYKNNCLISIAKGELIIDNININKKNIENKFHNLIEKLKFSLKKKVKDVKITFRLTNSPCCLIVNENDLSNNLVRILKSIGQKNIKSKPILEINPFNILIKYINNNLNNISYWANILYNQAILSEGGNLKNSSKFIKNLNYIFNKIIKK